MTIHLATSAALGGIVRRALHEPVSFVADNWMMGPCTSKRDDFGPVRCEFWRLRGRARTQWLSSFHKVNHAIDSDEHIVIWTSRLGSDTIALWALCAWRLQHFPDYPDIGVVSLGGPEESEDPLGIGSGFIRSTPADARRLIKDNRALSLTRVRNMASMWRQVSRRSPILSVQRGDSTQDRERLKVLGAHQAAFFPRLHGRHLLLSRIDELLFRCISKRGSTPVDVVTHSGAAGQELRQWMEVTGDMFIAHRLEQWGAHSEGALICEPHRADRVMLSARYSLSDKGNKILREGLDHIGSGPPLPIWGATAYDPLSPWVVAETSPAGTRLQE